MILPTGKVQRPSIPFFVLLYVVMCIILTAFSHCMVHLGHPTPAQLKAREPMIGVLPAVYAIMLIMLLVFYTNEWFMLRGFAQPHVLAEDITDEDVALNLVKQIIAKFPIRSFDPPNYCKQDADGHWAVYGYGTERGIRRMRDFARGFLSCKE
jgi:hypothetical protein